MTERLKYLSAVAGSTALLLIAVGLIYGLVFTV